MKVRTVSKLLYGEMVDMGGLPVRQPFPTQRVEQIDPFLLLHHANIKTPVHIEPDHSGVGPHPHRGFSPVTFVFKGGVHHRDSRGNNGVIYEGGAQWMNAGMGIMHSERPPQDIHEKGGRQEIIQLWINTPAAHKMDQPQYFPVSAQDVPVYTTEDKRVTLNLFAGKLLGLVGTVPTKSDVNAATLYFEKQGKIDVPFSGDHHSILYLLDGKVRLEGFGMAEQHHAVVFNNDGEGLSIEAIEPTRALLVTGKPIGEKVVAHGPFVMNSETQILEAMRDYQKGKMGILIEE